MQEWNGEKREITSGDVIWTPPGIKHWHGATATNSTPILRFIVAAPHQCTERNGAGGIFFDVECIGCYRKNSVAKKAKKIEPNEAHAQSA